MDEDKLDKCNKKVFPGFRKNGTLTLNYLCKFNIIIL